MNRQYPDLISLIAQDKQAMSFFKTLPDQIKCELSKNAYKIRTFESLKNIADNLESGANFE